MKNSHVSARPLRLDVSVYSRVASLSKSNIIYGLAKRSESVLLIAEIIMVCSSYSKNYVLPAVMQLNPRLSSSQQWILVNHFR